MIFPAGAQQVSTVVDKCGGNMDKTSAFQASPRPVAAADDDDDEVLSVRSLCPCLPCDASLSSTGSSTGARLSPKSQVSEESRWRGRSNACSSGNLASMEDSTPSEGHAFSRVKLMCSFGGKIMARPSDGKLRYVGGETRIASVNRDTNYVELMTKMCELCEQCVVLKYQMPEEDLDALISVCNQEDLENMMEEFDRLETADGLTRLRVFLFPSTELELDNFLDSVVDPRDQEQQYIEAVNGNLEAAVRREAGPSDLSVSGNDFIGSYPRDSTSSDFASSLVRPPSSALPVPTSRPASPRTFMWLKQQAAGLLGQALPSTSFRSHQVSDDTASSEQHLQALRADLQQKILQAEDARRGTPPSAAVGECGGHLHHQPLFAGDTQSPQQQVFQRSPSFGNCLCHPVPPAAGYHVVSAPTSPCLAMQGRGMCVHRQQHQVHVPAGTTQAAVPRYQGPHSPCCCDHWWRHQRLTCPRCGFVFDFDGQVVQEALPEVLPASFKLACPVTSAVPEAARFVQNGPALQQRQSQTQSRQEQRDGASDRLSVSPTSAAEALGNPTLQDGGDAISAGSIRADAALADKGTTSQLCTGVDESSAVIGASAFPEGTNMNREAANSEVPKETRKDEGDCSVAEKEAISRGLQTIKNDDLEEIRQLGSGTFGTVFYGKWRGSDVAIKRIKPSFFSGSPAERDKLVADFWREAGMLSNLHHPNVVAFYGVVPDGPDGTLATVTEYMVNGSLKQVLQRKDRTIDRRKRLLIAMDAAFGMEYLHEKHIVHFDLKCENLLVNMRDPHRPICKVGDFGLSKVKHQTMVSGGVRGTLPWMAPELLRDTGVTEKIDVFSFGVVMWELLTGEEPYARMHQADLIRRMMSSDLRPEVPDWCEPFWRALMERCWAANPTERPSFSEVARELRSMAASLHPNNQQHQHQQQHEQKQQHHQQRRGQ